jgi:hypothetical protein
VARKADDEKPWRLRDGGCSDDDEDRCDIRLDGDDKPMPVGNREADVHDAMSARPRAYTVAASRAPNGQG